MSTGGVVINGQAVIVGPDDHLVVLFPNPLDHDVAELLRDLLNKHLGDRWVAININGASAAAIRNTTNATAADLEDGAQLWTSAGGVIADISPIRRPT